MKYLCMLIVMTAIAFVAVGSASTAVAASEHRDPPPSRSKRCPPDDPRDKDQRDKDHRNFDHRDDKCGKGGDDKNP